MQIPNIFKVFFLFRILGNDTKPMEKKIHMFCNGKRLDPSPLSNMTIRMQTGARGAIFSNKKTDTQEPKHGSFFFATRPKPAYGRQGLDWIIGPGYSFVVFSTNRGI